MNNLNDPTGDIDLEMKKMLLEARENRSKPDVNHPAFNPTPKTEEKEKNRLIC